MATNFLKLLKPDANLAHNGFDLSQKHVFSSKPGNLTPVLSIETVPDDKFEIDLAAITRTRTMDTAAFVRGKFRWDFFFVPYVQLWHPFEQFITQRDDKHSSLQLSHAVCPNVELADVLYFLAHQYSFVVDGDNNEHVDVHNNPMVYDAVRLLDMLGYGDYRWLIDMVDDHQAVDADVIQEIDQYKGKYVNIFRLAAYQHIFYDFYRNKYWDVGTTGGIHADAPSRFPSSYLEFFNFDDVSCTAFSTSHITLGETDVNKTWSYASVNQLRLCGLLTLRFAQYKKDLFTASLPSQQFGAVSSVDVSSLGYLRFDSDGSPVSLTSVNRFIPIDVPSMPGVVAANSQASAQGYEGKWSMPSSFDVLQLRKAEALQSWKQNALRAGNMTDDAFRAHFGVSPYYYADNNVNFLGSFESALDVNSVEATAATSSGAGIVNNKVGNLAANGISISKGNKVFFHAKDFGVIMCIEHFVPDVEYRSVMLDKANRLYEDFDFFTPEFQNIGLEPVINADFDGTFNYVDSNGVLGYAPRYWQYKTAIDKCHGEFSRDGSMQQWVAPRLGSLIVAPGNGARDLSSFYVRTDFLDKVFAITSNELQNTDQFVHNVFFDVKAIRPMSVLGLPQF